MSKGATVHPRFSFAEGLRKPEGSSGNERSASGIGLSWLPISSSLISSVTLCCCIGLWFPYQYAGSHKQSRYLHLPHAGCCHSISELGGELGARSYFRGHIHTVHTVISLPLNPKPQFCSCKSVKAFSNFFLHPSTGIGSGIWWDKYCSAKWEYSSSSKRLLLSFVLYNRG